MAVQFRLANQIILNHKKKHVAMQKSFAMRQYNYSGPLDLRVYSLNRFMLSRNNFSSDLILRLFFLLASILFHSLSLHIKCKVLVVHFDPMII